MKRYLLMLAVSVWLIACTAPAVAPTSPTQGAAVTQDLATLHEEVGKLDCKDCHGAAKPTSVPAEVALQTVNRQCMACHGGMANVARLIKPRLANKHINAHDSHVVSIECVTCHVGHDKPSEAYCQNCHAFQMPMQLSKPLKAR